MQSPSWGTRSGTWSEGFDLLLLFFPKVSQIWGEGGWAEYQLEIQAQLCHRSMGPYFACSRGCRLSPAIPTHPSARNSTCLNREKHTHTHKKGLLLSVPLSSFPGCPSPQLTLPRGQDQHQEWEGASIPAPGWHCSLAHMAVWHSHTLLPTWKFSQEQDFFLFNSTEQCF